MRVSSRLRWMIYAAIAILCATGVGWLIADRLKDQDGEEASQIAMANLLMVHGGAAMVLLLLLGALVPLHIERAWRAKKNRVTGGAMAATNACLVVTAFGLYYSASPNLRAGTSNLHVAVGLALPMLTLLHVAAGRRNR